MKKIKIIIGILVLCMFVSCKQPSDKIEVLDTNIKTKTLYGELQFPVIARLAGQIIEIDTLLLVTTPFEDGIFDVFSKKTGKVKYTFDKRGRGPDEYMQPFLKQSGLNNITLWDLNRENFSEISLELNSKNETTFKLIKNIKIEEGGTHLFRLNDETIISTINNEGMFVLYNNEGEIIRDAFGKSPLRNVTSEYHLFQGRLDVSDSGDMFVFGTSQLGYLCSYDMKNIDQPELQWEIYIEKEPSYTSNNDRIKWDQDHVQGIREIHINNNKIYVLYSGRSIHKPQNTPEGAFADNFYVLNFEGDILGKYKLDIPILNFVFSENDSAIYGITMEDDWQIVKFDMF